MTWYDYGVKIEATKTGSGWVEARDIQGKAMNMFPKSREELYQKLRELSTEIKLVYVQKERREGEESTTIRYKRHHNWDNKENLGGWICETAIVWENVKIGNMVIIADNAIVMDGTVLAGEITVEKEATLMKNVRLGGRITVTGHAHIDDGVELYGNGKNIFMGPYKYQRGSVISGKAEVSGLVRT